MQVKSIAECSRWSILQYFQHSLSSKGSILQYFPPSLSWQIKIFILSIFEWTFYTNFTVYYIYNHPPVCIISTSGIILSICFLEATSPCRMRILKYSNISLPSPPITYNTELTILHAGKFFIVVLLSAVSLFDLILYVPSKIFHYKGTGLPGLNQY